ncbi:fam-l protein [Plasmodium malariae]|uniref:Fam-l protein n=1 Tax=Plasmodium malariae TaxID=5858 RepID=A0A1D3JI01_PLAMA|nr:fam-l protein [Plasmodium malariae]SBT85877.1 fam-l protein [Plasmodium malariae]
MEQKIKTTLFINISAFFLLPWIYHFKSDMSTFSKSTDENYKVSSTLVTRNYRLLAKYIQHKESINLVLKNDIRNNGYYKKKDIHNYEKLSKGKGNQTNDNSSKDPRRHKQDKKKKSCIFETKKYSHLEKKIFKELDFEDFLKNNRTISNQIYKKVIRKMYVLRIALPLILFSFLLISFILDLSVGYGVQNGLYKILKAFGCGEWMKTFGRKFSELVGGKWAIYLKPFFMPAFDSSGKSIPRVLDSFFGIVIYFLPFVILGVTFISWIIYYHKKVKKYEKIKFRKR